MCALHFAKGVSSVLKLSRPCGRWCEGRRGLVLLLCLAPWLACGSVSEDRTDGGHGGTGGGSSAGTAGHGGGGGTGAAGNAGGAAGSVSDNGGRGGIATGGAIA